MAQIRELLLRELRAACSAALARGADPDELAAEIAARTRCLRDTGGLTPAFRGPIQ